MKAVVVLLAEQISQYAREPVFGGKTAFERSILWADSLEQSGKTVIFSNDDIPFSVEAKKPVEFVKRQEWNIASFFQNLAKVSEECDFLIFAWADSPFLNLQIAEKLFDAHTRFDAEYTFSEGYPAGLAPEILSRTLTQILAENEEENENSIRRGSIFAALKKDINSYEIETVSAPKDLRRLRMGLFCVAKRDFMVCLRLYEILQKNPDKDICEIIEDENFAAQLLQTVPAFYNIQISSKCAGKCNFCPYPAECEKKFGATPDKTEIFMGKSDFGTIIQKISEYSGDAVVSLSLWGDPIFHPEFFDFAGIALENPKISLLIETTGEMIDENFCEKMSQIVAQKPLRQNGQEPIVWIISLDATTAETYKALHGEDNFEKAKKAFGLLRGKFGDAAYIQFLRMKENESELPQFLAEWKHLESNMIIQKYDWFCGKMADRKVVDLQPAVRDPCWHLRRDFNILVDGNVPLCREYLFESDCGNAISDEFAQIWTKLRSALEAQVKCQYVGLCERCDEYYTFNF